MIDIRYRSKIIYLLFLLWLVTYPQWIHEYKRSRGEQGKRLYILSSTDLKIFVTFWAPLRIATRNPSSLVLVSLKLSWLLLHSDYKRWYSLVMVTTQTEKVRAVKIKLIRCSANHWLSFPMFTRFLFFLVWSYSYLSRPLISKICLQSGSLINRAPSSCSVPNQISVIGWWSSFFIHSVQMHSSSHIKPRQRWWHSRILSQGSSHIGLSHSSPHSLLQL